MSIKIGKKYTTKRRNGQTVSGKVVDIKTTKRGPWAILEYPTSEARNAPKARTTKRFSELHPA